MYESQLQSKLEKVTDEIEDINNQIEVYERKIMDNPDNDGIIQESNNEISKLHTQETAKYNEKSEIMDKLRNGEYEDDP